jgi:biotin carboxyl carrier protein
VGVFWRAPEPGAPPFVEEGAEVQAGQALCIVEIMKLMQQITADVAGIVTAIHTENGGQVEFGTPLFSIAPTSA